MKIGARGIGIMTVLIYWGPSNALYYLWGFGLLAFVIVFKPNWWRIKDLPSKSIIGHSIFFIAIFFLSALANLLIRPSSFNNLFWSILTYGSTFSVLVALLSVPFREKDLEDIFKFSIGLSLVQVILGYVQMLYGTSFQSLIPFFAGQDAGDYFVGTTFNPGIGSLVAIKMSLTTLLFVPFWFRRNGWKNTLILFLLFIGWVLASALYTLLLGMFVLLLFFIFKRTNWNLRSLKINKSILYVALLGVLVITIFVFTQENNIRYVMTSLKYGYATLIGEEVPGKVSTRKIFYYKNTLIKLPKDHPDMLLVGMGPGNYSSRSAWLVSGEYLERQPFYIPVTPSKTAIEYTISIWSKNLIGSNFKGAGSITHQPFSTWLSVFAELGILGLFVMILLFKRIYKAVKTDDVSMTNFMQDISFGLRISLVYIILLFFMENLFEYPMVMGQIFVFVCAFIKVTSVRTSEISTSNV